MTIRVRGRSISALEALAQGEVNTAWIKRLHTARIRGDTLLMQAREAVTIEVAKCEQPNCGGNIVLLSRFEQVNPPPLVLLGGDNPVREVLKCYCQSCKHEHIPKQEWLTALSTHRKR